MEIVVAKSLNKIVITIMDKQSSAFFLGHRFHCSFFPPFSLLNLPEFLQNFMFRIIILIAVTAKQTVGKTHFF